MHSMRSLQLGGFHLGEPKQTHLAFGDRLCHRTNTFFDGHSWIDAMKRTEVENISTQTLQACVDCVTKSLGPAIAPTDLALHIADEADFGSQHNRITSPLQRATEPALVLSRAIAVRCVEQRAAKFQRAIERPQRSRGISPSVRVREAEGAQPDGCDLRAETAEFAQKRHPLRPLAHALAIDRLPRDLPETPSRRQRSNPAARRPAGSARSSRPDSVLWRDWRPRGSVQGRTSCRSACELSAAR